MPRLVKTCQVDGCDKKNYARGGTFARLCKKHYTQVARHGRLTPEKERGVVRVCLVEGCERTDTVTGYCRKHKRQLRAHGRLTPEREHQMGNEGCRSPGCPNKHRAKGYCVLHYNQARWQKIKKHIDRIKELEAKTAAAARAIPTAALPEPGR